MNKSFKEGIIYGENISRCTSKLIVSLIAERARMYEEYVGIEESKDFIHGAISAIRNNQNFEEEIFKINNKARK